MKICEVCGAEEEMEQDAGASEQTRMGWLHVCDSCQQDRKLHSFETME